MKTRLKSRIYISDVIPVLVFIIIFTSSDTLFFGTNKQVVFQKSGQIIDAVIALLLPGIIYCCKNKCSIKNKNIIAAIAMIGSILISAAVNHDFRAGIFFRIILIVLGMEIVELISLKDFCRVFYKIITFFAGCSVVGMLALRTIPAVSVHSIPLLNSENYSYWYYILYVQEAGEPMYARNYGIFREPGIFQMFLIAAMFIGLQYGDLKGTKMKMSMSILLMALLLTRSTTGFFVLILFAIFFLSKNNCFKERKKIQWMFFGVTTSIIVFLLISPLVWDKFVIWLTDILRKFDRTNSGYASFYARYSSITVNLLLWMKNPLFGIGLTKHDGYFSSMAMQFYGIPNSSNTNTLLSQFAAFGIVFGTVWMISLAAFSYRLGKNAVERFLVFLTLTILLVTENVSFSPVWNIFMWYGLTLVRIPDKTLGLQLVRRITFAKEADCVYKSW